MSLRPQALATLFVAVCAMAPAWVLAETIEVQMTTIDFEPTFVPASVTIQPGDTVRWINVDPFLLDHSVKSGTGSADPGAGAAWDSGILAINEYFEFTFESVGDYEYFSVPHEFEGMFGVVHVTNTTDTPEIEAATWSRIKATFSELLPKD